ncbi:uncharacterized protein MONOS_11110 [Monocercomonoides exilis]|uniref:uncharacterized protein n=1 Tax=Monocercomonoides exilis TaxID=2049356 RepID=UPI00355A555C|nr:hypothetical protein MONOS_11110 [Monocercomonoides exilis]|eukprot:MONOS_11110.1-p1 / transcript=MONOS_11110.1 / gene=MONOS_11110 / organism=Monocercomonoides_exilis_PA203 / gene_product=unspecified product / transcript_product=unspecified product / location=Mono_scaffold00539:18088-18663(-) / protein_length=116 / sequence_SO=supercontig / SO=protein_coding / is_pseudo=false
MNIENENVGHDADSMLLDCVSDFEVDDEDNDNDDEDEIEGMSNPSSSNLFQLLGSTDSATSQTGSQPQAQPSMLHPPFMQFSPISQQQGQWVPQSRAFAEEELDARIIFIELLKE